MAKVGKNAGMEVSGCGLLRNLIQGLSVKDPSRITAEPHGHEISRRCMVSKMYCFPNGSLVGSPRGLALLSNLTRFKGP